MPRRHRPERVEPALLQYSFESCPEQKLSSCCQYEYLASSELIRDSIRRNRDGQTDPLARAAFLLFGPDLAWTLSGGWPGPYLELLRAEGGHIAGRSSPRPKRRRHPVLAELVTPWIYLPDAKEVERLVPVYVNPYLSLPWLLKAIRELLLRDYPHLLRVKSSKPPFRVAFADLFRRQDPESARDFTLTEGKRGRGSRTEQCRVDLKALSAWRLSKQYGYGAQAAIDLLHAHRLSTYADVRSFRRAVRRATQKIAMFEERLRHYAQNVTA
jgi:hypothetical protein